MTYLYMYYMSQKHGTNDSHCLGLKPKFGWTDVANLTAWPDRVSTSNEFGLFSIHLHEHGGS